MKITSDLVRRTISTVAGEDVMPLVEQLQGRQNVSEFKLAEEVSHEINAVRNMLYRLYDANLVTFTRKKDKQKGWYIYYWTFNPKMFSTLVDKIEKNRIESLTNRLNKESGKEFYMCPNMCVRLEFAQSLEHDFKCPECGTIMNYNDNKRTIENIKRQIAEIEARRNDLMSKAHEQEKVLRGVLAEAQEKDAAKFEAMRQEKVEAQERVREERERIKAEEKAKRAEERRIATEKRRAAREKEKLAKQKEREKLKAAREKERDKLRRMKEKERMVRKREMEKKRREKERDKMKRAKEREKLKAARTRELLKIKKAKEADKRKKEMERAKKARDKAKEQAKRAKERAKKAADKKKAAKKKTAKKPAKKATKKSTLKNKVAKLVKKASKARKKKR